jgi:hypothetical protein
VAPDIPDKAAQFARNGDTGFVLVKLAPHPQMPVPLAQTQLGLPGDIADNLGLSLLSDLKLPADIRLVAIVPGRFNQDAPGVLVTGLGNGPLVAAGTTGVLGGTRGRYAIRAAGLAKRARSPISATKVVAATSKLRIHMMASTRGRIRHSRHCTRRASVSRSRASSALVTACRYSLKAMPWAG